MQVEFQVMRANGVNMEECWVDQCFNFKSCAHENKPMKN